MGIRILNNATGTGPGPAIKTRALNHGVVVNFTGTITGLVFQLEGRIDNSPWFLIGTAQTFTSGDLTNGYKSYFLPATPIDDIRINITTYTGTGLVSASYKSELN